LNDDYGVIFVICTIFVSSHLYEQIITKFCIMS